MKKSELYRKIKHGKTVVIEHIKKMPKEFNIPEKQKIRVKRFRDNMTENVYTMNDYYQYNRGAK